MTVSSFTVNLPAVTALPLVAAFLLLAACRGGPGSHHLIVGREFPGIDNLEMPDPLLLTGSEPQGVPGFASLSQMGVRTVISVDGSYPDVESAGRYGIRYVHLPLRHKGLDRYAILRLMRAFQELEKPIYLHCLHGVHRAPAAAAAILVGLKRSTVANALASMERAGTSRNYAGLYASVREAASIPEDATAQVSGEFVSKASISGLAEGMARLGRIREDISLLAQWSWSQVPAHPDLDAHNDTLIYAQTLRALNRPDLLRQQTSDFSDRMARASGQADTLAAAIRGQDLTAASTAFERLDGMCSGCHRRYRD